MTTGFLDEVLERVNGNTPEARAAIIKGALKGTAHMVWVPNPGPQSAAYNCEADELYYGGQAGGGKSDLGIGLAITRQTRSLILRRYNDDAKALAARAMEIVGSRDGYNGQELRLRPPSMPGKQIDFGGCKDLYDRERYKGDPHDLIVFDEIPDFLEAQYTFIIGWNRSTDPNQKCRVVCTGNPPTTAEGLWVIKRWAAWLDPNHPRPARDGELRWYTTGSDGKEIEVDGKGPHIINGEAIMARSRTFIRARLSDNPDLAHTDYDATLAALPPELRAAYRDGRFDAGLKDKPFQIIPTAWVREAIGRWGMFDGRPPPGVPMCAIAADCTGGGTDPLVIGARYDGWFDKFEVIPGREIPMDKLGRTTAGMIITHRRDQAIIIIDMGGGYGGAAYEHLKTNFEDDTIHPKVIGYKGSEGSNRRSHDKQLGFKNKRTEVLWRMREALDPDQAGGSPIMLPDDPEMVADLTAVSYEIRGSEIVAESKEDVCARLGRSTDKGDTVCMCWSAGPTASTDGAIWDEQRRKMMPIMGARRPSVLMGRRR